MFQVYACMTMESALEAAMKNDQFWEAIRWKYATFRKVLTRINTSKSVSMRTVTRFTELFREDRCGSTGLDHRIFAELKKWMVHLMLGQIQDEKEDEEKEAWQAALLRRFSNRICHNIP